MFYPNGLAQKRELEYASSKLTSIEINGTYYGSQKPESFAKWHDETPDDFVFSLKATRYATNRRVLGEAAPTIERFFNSGLTNLKAKLGPINWQFATTKKFDPDDFAAFLALLPKSVGGLAIRHAVEVRHESFRTAEFVAAGAGARRRRGDRGRFRIPANRRCDRAVRLRADHGNDRQRAGGLLQLCPGCMVDARAKTWAAGGSPPDLKTVAPQTGDAGRDVFLYVISGFKDRNPAAATALIDRVG